MATGLFQQDHILMENCEETNDKETPCDREFVLFHGYKIFRDGSVCGKGGKHLKPEKRFRRGNNGVYDLRVRLYYNGKRKKWTLQRLVAACFLGPIDGYEINHKDRDSTNNHVDNLERVTPSENQLHWRANEGIGANNED